jgi:outer membrane biosynthesis protein TonB
MQHTSSVVPDATRTRTGQAPSRMHAFDRVRRGLWRGFLGDMRQRHPCFVTLIGGMRCTTCGTENEPDSRFCGGCGARMGTEPKPRLAPTHKIQDDAAYPQHAPQPAAAPSGPVSYAPPSLPPSGPHSSPPSGPRSSPPPSVSTQPRSSPPHAAAPHLSPATIATPPAGSLRAPPAPLATPQPTRPRPPVTADSEAFAPPPRPRTGLIIAVLLLDIGLAIAGGVLLFEGLENDEPASNTSSEQAKPDEKRTEAPATPTPPTPTAAAAEQTAAATPAPASAAPAAASPAPAPPGAATTTPAARKDATKQRDDKPVAAAPTNKGAPTKPPATAAAAKPSSTPTSAAAKPSSTATSAAPTPTAPTPAAAPQPPAPATTPPRDEAKASDPQDPSPAVDTRKEIDAAAARSKAAFERCEGEHAGQGKLVVAFRVHPDGRIANATAVENSTNNSELARCYVAEVSAWRVSPHDGAAIDMSRAFNVR